MFAKLVRLFLLCLFCGVVLSLPFIQKLDHPLDFPDVAPNMAGVSKGVTFPVAGQELVEAEEEAEALILVAPDTAEVGELVRLSLHGSNVDSIVWQVARLDISGRTVELSETEDFEVIENGFRAMFSSRVPGKYLFMISGAKDKKAHLVHHTLIVEGDATPIGPLSLSQRVTKWANAVPAYVNKPVHKTSMAGVFRETANAEDIAVDKLMESAALANAAILAEEGIEMWTPFFEKLEAELDALGDAENLTREQYRTVFLAVAKGLERAK